MTILAIDPGPEKSAWVLFNYRPLAFGIHSNADLLRMLTNQSTWLNNELIAGDRVVIEQIAGMGMVVGFEVFETCFWSGRFAQAAGVPFERIKRGDIKLHICGSARAKDKNIRQALIDRFGGPASIKKGGALYGVSKDVWAALAVAVTWWDTRKEQAA